MKPRKARVIPDAALTKGEATRNAILDAAAAAIRRHGPDGVSVVAVMREAGLTHGGFYAHFKSKDALVADAIRHMFAGGRDKYVARIGSSIGPDALKSWIDSYISRGHRDDPGRGCALAALISDMPRLKGEARRAYDEGVRGIAGRIAQHLPAKAADAIDAASSLMAEMAGAVAIARAVSDPHLSERFLKNSRAALKARIDEMSAA